MRNRNPFKAVVHIEPEFLIAEEVSTRLRLPLSTVYYLAKTGALPAIQLGRAWRFPARGIAELAERRSNPRHEEKTSQQDARGGNKFPVGTALQCPESSSDDQ